MSPKELKINIQKFTFNRLEDEESFCEVFFEEPQENEKKTLGNLYFMGEIRSPYKDPPYILNLFNSVIKSEYYSKPRRPVSESLEASLKAANILLSNLAKEGNIDWIRNTNLLVAAFSKNMLYFSSLGEISALLKRGGNVTDLIKRQESHNEGIIKSFTSIISGDLHQDDTVLFSTKGLLKIFQKESLINSLRTSTSVPLNKIEEIIRSNEHLTGGPIAALLLEANPSFGHGPRYASNTYGLTTQNLAKLILINAFKLLRGLIWIAFQIIRIFVKGGFFILKNLGLLFLALFKKLKSRALTNIPPKESDEPQKDIKISITQNVKNKFSVSSLKEKVLNKFKLFSKYYSLVFAQFEKNKYLRLLIDQKQFSAFLLILIFSLGVVYFNSGKNIQDINLKSQIALIQEIKEKKENAEEALIYQDKQKASILLVEAEELINRIYADGIDKDLETELSDLKQSISGTLDELNGVIKIEEPKTILELKKLPLDFLPTNFSSSERIFYFYDSAKNIFYKFDPEEDSKDFVFLPNADTDGELNLSLYLEELQKTLFYIPYKILFYENNKLSAVIPIPLNSGDYFKDVARYKENVYFLDAGSGQIVKYQITDQGIEFKEKWIKDGSEENIKEAKSIAIDGTIYILTKDGKILRYSAGKLYQSWESNKIGVSLGGANKIFTKTYLKYIYILDSFNKRVLVLDKNGNVIKQYKSGVFDNLNDIEVIPEKNKIHLLNGLKVYEIEL